MIYSASFDSSRFTNECLSPAIVSKAFDCENPLRIPLSPKTPRLAYANPQSPSDDSTSQAIQLTPTKRGRVFPSSPISEDQKRFPFLLIGFILIGFFAIYSSRETVNSTAEQVCKMELTRRKLDEAIKKAEKELNIMKRELAAVDLMQQRGQSAHNSKSITVSNVRALHEMKIVKKRLKEEEKEANLLKRRVQSASLAGVEAKYGTGLHQVEFELVFPDSLEGPSRFIVELAPTELMPHTIQTFLEMVSNGLLDGCSFILNALHVIKAAPLPYDGSSAKAKAKAFSELGLESVAFKEYSEKYPHERYTMAFAADGSPSFYINTANNTDIHAGDPCFGKVVSGFDAVKRLEDAPTSNGIWFQKRIGIKSVKILTQYENLHSEHATLRSKPQTSRE